MSNVKEEVPIEVKISKIGAGNFNKVVTFLGVVVATSKVKHIVKEACFICNKCGSVTIILQDEEKMVKPNACIKCKKKRYNWKFDGKKSDYVDYQKVLMQERYIDIRYGTPQTIEVRLLDNLTGIVNAGDEIKVTGLVCHYEPKADSLIFTPYMRAEKVEVLNQKPEDMVLTEEEMSKIEKLSKHPLINDILSSSVAPHIFGKDNIKKAIMCSLFGGVTKDEIKNKKRGYIHVLIVGDPATAKSQLLESATILSPKGLYTGGQGSSGVGLTAALLKDKNTGEYMLHAGALVRGNNGVVCIDEIDKMESRELGPVNIAMSQGKVTITKGGNHYTLPANTTVIAACNPTDEYYDENTGIYGNLSKIAKTLLTRFDLIFLCRDEPDIEKDDEISKFKLGLKDSTDPNLPIINPEMFRKYISFAKRINPVLDIESKKLLDDYWQKKRMNNDTGDELKITFRQHEGLIRLTEAFARIRLSEVAVTQDVQNAIGLMDASIENFGTAESLNKNWADATKRKQLGLLLDKIEILQTGIGDVDESIIYREMENKGIERRRTEELLKILVNDGRIFEPRTRRYAVI